MTTVQVPLPLQAPLQPVKVEPEAGVAVRVTVVPLGKDAEQVGPQLIPAGLLVTVPLPLPALVTVRVNPIVKVKVAVTDLLASMRTVQVVAVPLQAPLQPVKVEPAAGVAVRVTVVPLGKAAEHMVPQSIPAGLLVTLPLPLPALVTVRVKVVTSEKVAVTNLLASMTTVQVVAVPLQAPLQPVKVEPEAGAAVRVTVVPLRKAAEHLVPQSIPAGLLVTVPLPLPALVTVRVTNI